MEVFRFTRSHRVLLMSLISFAIFTTSYIRLNSEYNAIRKALQSGDAERINLQKNSTLLKIARANLELKVNELEQRLYDLDVVYKDTKNKLEDAHLAFEKLEERNIKAEEEHKASIEEAKEAAIKANKCFALEQDIQDVLGNAEDIRKEIQTIKNDLKECKEKIENQEEISTKA